MKDFAQYDDVGDLIVRTSKHAHSEFRQSPGQWFGSAATHVLMDDHMPVDMKRTQARASIYWYSIVWLASLHQLAPT